MGTPLDNISVPYDRLWAQTSGSADMGGGRHVMTWKVAWHDLRQFVWDVAGVPRKIGNTLLILTPWECPEWRGFWAQSISWRGVARRPQTGAEFVPSQEQYSWAEVSVTFGTPNFPVNGDAWIETSLAGAEEYVTLPNRVFKFTDGYPTGQDYGVHVGLLEVHVTRYQIYGLGTLAPFLLACMGRVNIDPIDWLVQGMTFDPGTVRFSPPDMRATASLDGKQTNSLNMVFQVREFSWQYALHPDGIQGWQPILDGGGAPPYRETDQMQKLLTI